MNKQTKIAIVAIVAVVAGTSVVLSSMDSSQPIQVENTQAKLQVLSSFYPIYEFSRIVGGDRADVSLLVPVGTEPHDWEPTIQDVQRMEASDIIVINGLGFEVWTEDLENIGYQGNIVDTSMGITPITYGDDDHDEHGHGEEGHDEEREEEEEDHGDEEREEEEEDHGDEEREEEEEDHGDEEGDEHGHGEIGSEDPHIWLNPVLVKVQVQNIADAYAEEDPENGEYYQNNAAKFIRDLDGLDSQIRGDLSGCGRDFIAFHNAFSYFAAEYELNQHTIISSTNPHGEPTARTLESVIDTAGDLGINIVFTEEGVDPRTSQVIADEIGGRVLVLSPLEISDDLGYIDRMKKNLSNLKEALC